MEKLTAQIIMSNVSGKIFDESRTVDSIYLDPILKKFASQYGKLNGLSLTFILARIIEFCASNKNQIGVDRTQLIDKLSRTGSKTTVRVKVTPYKDFSEYTKNLDTSNSAYLNMILKRMYEDQNLETEFNSSYLEKLLLENHA